MIWIAILLIVVGACVAHPWGERMWKAGVVLLFAAGFGLDRYLHG